VLWDAFARRVSEDELPSLVRSASRVWAAVDHHTTRIHLAYLSEAAVVAREQEHERAQLVARLLTTDARDPQVVAQVATALDVAADADFAVAAAPLPATRPLRDAADELSARGISVHLQDVDRRPVLIAQLPAGVTAVPRRWLQEVPCGLAPVARTLAGVPRAVRIAAELAGTGAAEAGPRALPDVWSSVVAGRLGELGDALAAEVFGRMRGIGAGERSRLLETASAYLRTGSAGAVAGELYCHRNTVLNRLRRIDDLTGCDLTRPDQAALFTVARACDPSA
jgi:hypothetical protein